MLSLIISLVLAVGAWVLCCTFFFSSVWAGLLPFFVVFFASMIFISRFVGKKVQVIMQEAQLEMQELSKIQSPETRKRMMPKIMDKAIESFNKGYKYQYFQVGLAGNLNAQIGTLYYVQKRFDEAEPYLSRAFMLNGAAIAMHACIMYNKKDYKAMQASFERAVKFSPKQSILWNTYAWCRMQAGDSNEAINILNRAAVFIPNDQITKANLDLLKNNGKMRMSDFGEAWYQFLLEEPSMQELQKLAQAAKLGSPFAKNVRHH